MDLKHRNLIRMDLKRIDKNSQQYWNDYYDYLLLKHVMNRFWLCPDKTSGRTKTKCFFREKIGILFFQKMRKILIAMMMILGLKNFSNFRIWNSSSG